MRISWSRHLAALQDISILGFSFSKTLHRSTNITKTKAVNLQKHLTTKWNNEKEESNLLFVSEEQRRLHRSSICRWWTWWMDVKETCWKRNWDLHLLINANLFHIQNVTAMKRVFFYPLSLALFSSSFPLSPTLYLVLYFFSFPSETTQLIAMSVTQKPHIVYAWVTVAI